MELLRDVLDPNSLLAPVGEQLADEQHVAAIALVGSHAVSRASPGSDLDVFVYADGRLEDAWNSLASSGPRHGRVRHDRRVDGGGPRPVRAAAHRGRARAVHGVRRRHAGAHALPWPQGGSQGLGWMLGECSGERVLSHGGGTTGQRSSFEVVPGCGFAVALCTNGPGAERLWPEVARWIYAEHLGLERIEHAPVAEGPVPAALEPYAGVYENASLELTLSLRDGVLVAVATPRQDVGGTGGARRAGTRPAPAGGPRRAGHHWTAARQRVGARGHGRGSAAGDSRGVCGGGRRPARCRRRSARRRVDGHPYALIHDLATGPEVATTTQFADGVRVDGADVVKLTMYVMGWSQDKTRLFATSQPLPHSADPAPALVGVQSPYTDGTLVEVEAIAALP